MRESKGTRVGEGDMRRGKEWQCKRKSRAERRSEYGGMVGISRTLVDGVFSKCRRLDAGVSDKLTTWVRSSKSA